MKEMNIEVFLFLILINIKYALGTFAFFPTRDGSAAYGIFGAIAVPLDLPHRNVFVSYNFEANYNLPYEASNILPGPLEKFEGYENGLFEQEGRDGKYDVALASNHTDTSIETATEIESEESTTQIVVQTRKIRSLISRRSFYKILQDKLKFSGFKGKPCILKLICETSHYNLGENNGILGDLFHVVFSPSASESEQLPLDYYRAEEDGIYARCDRYDKICPRSILDIFSIPMSEVFNLIK